MKIFQKVQGNLATNLYVTSNNKTAALHLVKEYDWDDVIPEPYKPMTAVWVDNDYPKQPPYMAQHVFIEYKDGTYCLIDDSGTEQIFNSKAEAIRAFPEAKTASVKKADSVSDSDLELLDSDLDLGLPDSDGLWLDKYGGLWEVCADEAMMIHDSSSAWGLDDDMEVVPLDQLGEFVPFRRAELKAVGRKANASAFASKPVASVNVMLTRMNVKTGSERLLKSFKTSSADEALKLAEKWFGKMTEVKTADETKTASRTFKTARRKLSMQEKLRLIDEDRLEDDDFDL